MGLFWVGQRDLGNSELEAGVRWETVEYSPTTQGLSDRTFDSLSASLGLVGSINENLTLSGMADLCRVAGFELPTNSYEDLSISLQRKLVVAGKDASVFCTAVT